MVNIHSDPIDIPSSPQSAINSNGINTTTNSTSADDSTPRHHRQTASFSSSSGGFPASFIPGSVNSIRPPIINEFNLNGWSFKSIKSSISSANQIETLSHEIGFPLPTMFFGHNQISIHRDNHLEFTFNPIDAIKSVSKSAESVPIRIAASHADFWRQRSQSEVIFDYDWTYTPRDYLGNISGTSVLESVSNDPDVGIDYNKLKQQDPILFFDENILYEDELGDNGISMLSVKLRVMEYGFYLLLNHFLRVDQVIFKSIAIRYYHEFSTNFILKEVRIGEDSFESIQEKMTLSGSSFKDNEAVQLILPVTSKIVSKINF